MRPEDVHRNSLKEMLGFDKKGRNAFSYLEGCVKLHLFSKYERRREMGIKMLREYFCKDMEVARIEGEEATWAYIRINKKLSYILVNIYPHKISTFEFAPDEKEIREWSELLY